MRFYVLEYKEFGDNQEDIDNDDSMDWTRAFRNKRVAVAEYVKCRTDMFAAPNVCADLKLQTLDLAEFNPVELARRMIEDTGFVKNQELLRSFQVRHGKFEETKAV